jgi:hypothetical protein
VTALQPAVLGDVGDTRIVRLDGIEDLSGVTALEAHVWVGTRRVATQETLTATVLDPTERTITVNLGTDLVTGWLPNVATRGEWNVEYQATFGSTVLTWPNGKPDTIDVREQGD